MLDLKRNHQLCVTVIVAARHSTRVVDVVLLLSGLIVDLCIACPTRGMKHTAKGIAERHRRCLPNMVRGRERHATDKY